MPAETLLLAFLAARYPVLYAAQTIEQRVNRSGFVDCPIAALPILSRLVKLGLVALEVDPLTGESGFSATAEGRKRWILDGQPLIQ